MACNTKIFCSNANITLSETPLPKLFNVTKQMGVNDWGNQVKEWVIVLTRENEKLKNEAHLEEGLVLAEAFEFLCLASRKLGLSREITFLAADIYQRFSLGHIESVMRTTSEIDLPVTEREDFMVRVQQKVAWQAPLRALTCLWISTKLTNHITIMNAKLIQDLLKECGVDISLQSVYKSEVRILEQINFYTRRSSTAFEYVSIMITFLETMLSADSSSSNSTLAEEQIDEVFRIALQVLDFIYLNYDLVYRHLFSKVTGSEVVSEHTKPLFSRVRCDRLLLAVSVVASAGSLLGNEDVYLFFVNKLSPALKIPAEDIDAFVSCIIDIITNSIGR